MRGTPNQNILIRRCDVSFAIDACLSAGLKYKCDKGRQCIRFDNEEKWDRSSTWFLIAEEKYSELDLFPTPDVAESIRGADFQVIDLLPLVFMKLTAYRIVDRVHLRDLVNVDVINADWLQRVPLELRGRLNEVLDDPFG